MKITIRKDVSCEETEIIILTNTVDDSIHNLETQIREITSYQLKVYEDGNIVLLSLSEVIKIYSANHSIFVVTRDGEYTIKSPLYNVEEALADKSFLRISNTEIINIKKIESIDVSIKGNILINLKYGIQGCVSRRYIPKIRKILEV